MTTSRHVWVECEGKDCQENTSAWYAWDANEAREVAHRIGWRRSGTPKRDLCPACDKKTMEY